MIWRESFQPRILNITSKTTQHRNVYSFIRFRALEPPPIALQICHESRALALKHYIPSFHSTTFPSMHASEVKQTAIYFNPEIDTVRIVTTPHDYGRKYEIFSLYTDEETIRRIKTLAVLQDDYAMQSLAMRLPTSQFEGLKTLILVVEREAGMHEEESIWEDMEDQLLKIKDQLALPENCEEWTPPVVKVMSAQTLENQLWF
jgi:hypothetical protein